MNYSLNSRINKNYEKLPKRQVSLTYTSFLDAYEAFSDTRLNDVNLHIVGDENKIFNATLEKAKPKSNIHFLGRISDEELIDQYSNASLFILPSLYEGFGIPPLEALMCESPIALSDIPVFHEIFEDAAIYFNPYNKEDIINIVLKNTRHFVNSESILKILKKYSWEKSAKNVLNATIKAKQ